MNASMSLEKKEHYPVMLNQVLSIISPQHGGTFIDCTFGAGGYSREILKHPGTKVIALDRDKLAERYANILNKEFPTRFTFFKSKFSNLNQIISPEINPKAIIFDLGISSMQLKDQERSFSFTSKNFLNMEMGINKHQVYDIINTLDVNHLSNIIKILGEEKDGKKIAKAICKQRTKGLIKTSEELVEIIKSSKKNYKNFKRNPATKTFQALRVFVNQELTELIQALSEATKIIKKDGILIFVSFHSLEDRIIKYFFNFYSNLRKNPSRYLPSKNEKFQLFNFALKKPLRPLKNEINENNNSRSAKLRYAVRNNNSFFYPKEFEIKFHKYFNLEEVNL